MRAFLLFLLVVTLSGPASASMLIDRSILTFEAGSPSRQDVTVTNPTEDTMFLEVEVLQVTDPGTDDERREVVRDPASIGLIAAPRRLAIPAGGRRLVRLVNLDGHGDTERVYRVNITPIQPPAEAGEERQIGLRIVVAYQLLIFVAPETARSGLEARREGNQLHLHNTGNVNVLLGDGRQCRGGLEGSDCESVTGRRLYPGNQTVLELPMDEAVSFQVETAGQRSRRRFD